MPTNFIGLQQHNKFSRCFELAGSLRFARRPLKNRKVVLCPAENRKLNMKVRIKQKYFLFYLQFSYKFGNGAAGILLPVAWQVNWSGWFEAEAKESWRYIQTRA